MQTATSQRGVAHQTRPSVPSDRQLVDAVRRGSDAAWRELLGRHLASLHALLRTRREHRVLDVGLDELRRRVETEPDAYEGEPAVRSFRPWALATVFGGSFGPMSSAVGGGAEMLAVSFARLPEPWQTALWHRHIDGLGDPAVAPLVGRDPAEVGELMATARRGLAHAFLVECDGVRPIVNDVEPLAVVIDEHLADALVPRLTGRTAAQHRQALCRVGPRARRRRV